MNPIFGVRDVPPDPLAGARERLRERAEATILSVAQFTSKLTAAEREEIITRAAFRETTASIHAAIGGKVSLRTVQRIVKAEAQEIASRCRTFEHQGEQREREEQHWRSRGEEPLQYEEPHAVAQGSEPEPRYASELGPNARERVGLPAMPPEETTEQFLARSIPVGASMPAAK